MMLSIATEQGQKGNIVGRVLAHLGLLFDTLSPYDPQSLAGVIPEERARSKLYGRLKSKQRKIEQQHRDQGDGSLYHQYLLETTT